MSSALSFLAQPKVASEYLHHHLVNFTAGTGFINIDEIVVSWVLAGIVLFVAWRVGRRLQAGAPSGVQNVLETLVDFANSQATSLFPHAKDPLVGPMALTIFVWVLIMNAMDLVPVDLLTTIAQLVGLPFGFAPAEVHWRPVPTAGLAVPGALAISVFLLTIVYGIRFHGVLGYFKRLVSHPFGIYMAPFNLAIGAVEGLAKPLSLTLRLFGNMFAGELIFILIALFGFTWWALPIQGLLGLAWRAFESLIIVIQAFIFMLLSIVYMAMVSDTESH